MTTKRQRGTTIADQIIALLYERGPMSAKDMVQAIPNPYKSVYTKALELKDMGLLTKDEDGVWSLVPGVTPQTLSTGEIVPTGTKEGEEAPAGRGAPVPTTGVVLDQKGKFVQHMIAIGVTPREAIPTIAEIFFSGDIDSLKWLRHVITREAAGYVSPHQQRLVLGWWANTRGLPYDEEDLQIEEPLAKGQRAKSPGKAAVVERPLDTGLGWKVGKDQRGDWVPLPGGPLTYDDALAGAERRALIDSYAQPVVVEEEGGEEETEGKPVRRGGTGSKGKESLQDYMLRKMIDQFVEGGKDKGESAEVKELRSELARLERVRQDDRFDRLEGMVAQIASRDPWDEYHNIEERRKQMGLGVGGPIVTDQSPAVQLVKDATDKMDKNVNRLVGVMERVILRSGEFTLEETGTPEERESKAALLLDEAQGMERSRSIRRRAFGA